MNIDINDIIEEFSQKLAEAEKNNVILRATVKALNQRIANLEQDKEPQPTE